MMQGMIHQAMSYLKRLTESSERTEKLLESLERRLDQLEGKARDGR